MSSSSTETPVDYLRDKGEAHTMTTYCPAGAFALAGGWEGSGADVLMTESYPSQLPRAGAGAWR